MEMLGRFLNTFGPLFFLFLIAWLTFVPFVLVLSPLSYATRSPLWTLWILRVVVRFLSGEVLLHFLCASCISFRLGVGPEEVEHTKNDKEKEEKMSWTAVKGEEDSTRVQSFSSMSSPLFSSSHLSPLHPAEEFLCIERRRRSGWWSGSCVGYERCVMLRVYRLFLWLVSMPYHVCCGCHVPGMRRWRQEKGKGEEIEKSSHLPKRKYFIRALLSPLFLLRSRKHRLSSHASSASPEVLEAIEQYIFTAEHLLTPFERRRWILDAPRRYCPVCQRYKAPREHHCGFCGECVAKMDHHCVWLGQCVDGANHRYFFSLLWWVWISVGVECLLLGYGYVAYGRAMQHRVNSTLSNTLGEESGNTTHLLARTLISVKEPVVSSSSSFPLQTCFGPRGADLQSSAVVEALATAAMVWMLVSLFLFFFAKNILTNTTSIEKEVLAQKRQLFDAVSSFQFENPYRLTFPCTKREGEEVSGTGLRRDTTMSVAYRVSRLEWDSLAPWSYDACPPPREACISLEGKGRRKKKEDGDTEKKGCTAGPSSTLPCDAIEMPSNKASGAEEKIAERWPHSIFHCWCSCLLNALEVYGVLDSILKGSLSSRSGAEEEEGDHTFRVSSFPRRVATLLGIQLLNSLRAVHPPPRHQSQEGKRSRAWCRWLPKAIMIMFLWMQVGMWGSLLCIWLLTVPMISGHDDAFDGLDYPLA